MTFPFDAELMGFSDLYMLVEKQHARIAELERKNAALMRVVEAAKALCNDKEQGDGSDFDRFCALSKELRDALRELEGDK